jgi:methionyl-tRNA formyltransferase
MKIVSVPHPALKKVSSEVGTIDKKLINFVRDLEKTLANKRNPEGVGLSAPQVDKNWRVFSIYLDHSSKSNVRTLINPTIVHASDKMTLSETKNKPYLEGCLSIPNIFGPVWRHETITLEYGYLENNQLITKTEKFTDFPSRVVQHEIDHLDGILFTDRAVEQELPLYTETNGELIEIELIS